MFSSQWLSSLKNQLRVRSSRRKHRARRHQAPFSRALVSRNAAESLEDRTLLTVFTVVNTDDSGEGSLRDAIEQANASAGADTISFDASLADQTIQLMNQLRITDDLTIIGLGSDQLTIDANHTGRIFDVYDGTHSANLYVSISGLTLANGDANVLPNLENTTPSIGLGGSITYKRYNTGGAIFNYEHLSVSDLVFQDNQARLGGAISSQSGAGATMSIENSVFLRNTASAGGAIYSRSSVTVTGSSFVENQATGDGGAIYAYTLNVSGSSFTENSAQGSGGAIYHPYGELQVADSTFTGNVAGEEGGGIYHSYRKGWSVQVVTVPDGPLAGQQFGSYVLRYPDPTEIANCKFYENSATRGGGIYSVEMSAASHPLTDVPYSPSYAVAASLPIKFENSFDPQVIINDCYFSENTAELGGAVLNRSGSMQVIDSTFAENTASVSGGALYNYGNLVMEDSTLSTNSANSGGGVYNTGNFKLIDGYFLQNHAASIGGGVASSLGYIRVNETYFGSNSAGQLGGAIYLVQGSSGSIVDDMGEILSNPSPLIENSIFNRNTAGNGGGIYNSPWMADIGFQTLNVLNSTFYHNEATQSGGGIFNGRAQLSISGSDFSQNQAIDGAGINNLGGSVFIEESTLSENIATGSGGAIATLGHLSLFNSTLSGNQAALAGGGIYHRNGAEFSPDGTEVNLSPIDPSQFPIVDPGLQLLPANPPQILDLIFVVSLNGVIDTTLPINDNDSDVPADSVPLWLLNSSLDVVNSSLVGNTAGASGGGISTPEPGSRSTTTVKNSIVAGNAATAGSQIAGEFTAQTNIIQDSIEDLIDPVLRDNGGPTKTHALLPGSIAINAGSNEIVENADLMTDQRGAGFERIIDGTVDIGAFELHSMTFVVDTNSDIDDGDYSSGQLSLREAIRLSNENPSDIDQITFDASLAGQTIVLSGELEIRDSVLITGLGANLLTLDGNQNGRIFNIHGFWTGPMRQVVIDGLTLTNGVDMSGGAIYTDKILTVRDCLITHNHSTRSGGGIYSEYELNVINTTFLLNSAALSGGAIKAGDHRTTITGSSFERNTAQSGGAFSASQFYIRGPKVSISDSTFFENSASSAGGAIYIYEGTLTIEDSEISKNTTSQWGAGVYSEHAAISITGSTLAENLAVVNGGGVYLLDGSLNLRESTLSGNFAGSTGGGIHSTGDLTIYNSTISGNTTNGFGGGVYQTAGLGGPTEIEFYSVSTADFIYYRETPNELTIVNSTITGNHAAISAGGIFSSAETFELANSIVAGNSAAGNAQISGVYSSGINIIQDSIEGVLAPVLRDNGGPTKTHALLAGSAAINGGDNAAAEAAGLMNDQRGDGSSRIVDGTVDIGAFEVQAPLAQIDLRVVKSKTPTSGNGESASLPENITWIDEWGNYWVEIWISTADTTDLGIMSANLDLTYNTEITTATSIEYGAAFTENQTGTINDQTGTIENLSAETSLTNVGDDQRVLFARIKFESTTDDAVDLDLEGQSLNAQSLSLEISQPQILLADHTASDVIYGLAPATQIWANPYDFNDDDAINVADLKILISTYHSVSSKSNSPHKWITDLNRNDRVDLRDLILFVRNFGKDKADRSQNYFPENFIELWFDHLIVDSQSEVQANAHPVTQSAAETVLESVVEQVSPQLTPSQNETLSQVDIEVVDLAGETLGRAVPGTIYIDVNAAGRGWFVDASPADHSEFTYDSELTLIALPDSSVAGQVDLFTVILHELGHLLGYEHETDGVMQETLVPGVRRLPDWADETDSFFSTLSGESELLPF